jgi:glucan phosphoethanolaminetransferase (alkaline phosphatase superfamily)
MPPDGWCYSLIRNAGYTCISLFILKAKTMSYKKFTVMMIISFIIMYTVMFLNIDNISHYHTSTTRVYMAILMVAPMAVVMMLMMGKMYPNKKLNTGIILTAIVVFIITLIGLRTQIPITDVQYMKAMIPHHSSAILVSKHANLKDPEVRKLAEQIIQSQEKEIGEMEAMLKRFSTE